MANARGRLPPGDELVFMALGGIGEIGMNCYLYGLGPADARQWLMIDLGITFPEGENDPGIDVILDLLDVPRRLRAADLALTGEGQLDRQTSGGKVIAGLARAADEAGVHFRSAGRTKMS